MLEWRDGMCVDHETIDRAHQQQRTLINRFVSLPPDEQQRENVIAVLRDLYSLSVQHFTEEEEAMRRQDHPDFQLHCVQHRRLTQLLQDIRSQVEIRDSAFTFAHVKTQADAMLQFWFVHHFARDDLKLRGNLKATASR